jgi:hypothetical protein
MNREQSREISNGELSIIFLVSETFHVLFSVSIVGRCKKIFKKFRPVLLLENVRENKVSFRRSVLKVLILFCFGHLNFIQS